MQNNYPHRKPHRRKKSPDGFYNFYEASAYCNMSIGGFRDAIYKQQRVCRGRLLPGFGNTAFWTKKELDTYTEVRDNVTWSRKPKV